MSILIALIAGGVLAIVLEHKVLPKLKEKLKKLKSK